MSEPTKPKSVQAREFLLAQEQRRTLMRNASIAIVSVFVVGAIIWYVADQTAQGEQDKLRPPANPAEQTIPNEGEGHEADGTPLTFNHYPPSSGTHYGAPAAYGYYEQPVSEGYFVHSLEHGAVLVLYNCPTACPDLQAKLNALYDSAPKRRCDDVRMIVAPYSQGMTTPIALIAWGKQLDLAAYDEKAILNFYKRYEDRGPELIPCA